MIALLDTALPERQLGWTRLAFWHRRLDYAEAYFVSAGYEAACPNRPAAAKTGVSERGIQGLGQCYVYAHGILAGFSCGRAALESRQLVFPT